MLVLGSLIVFILESPATLLNLLKQPLQEQNITYGEMQGGLLSGFSVKDVNYNNQVHAKEVALHVDFEALKNRVLLIDNLVLKDAQIDKAFLTSLIDTNSTDENKSETNTTLPFDTVFIKNADISLQNTGYQNYYINSAKLHLADVKTNMKKEHSGTLTFLLDSNMTQADIRASFKNETYDVWAKVEGNREFIAPFVKEQNVTLLVNPKLTLKAKGDLDAVNYEVNIHKLSLKQNAYLVNSKLFRTKGTFNINKNSVNNVLNTELDGNVAHLKLNAKTMLDLDDINNTLVFNIDGNLKPKKNFIPAELAEQNITIQALPKIGLFAKGDMNDLIFKTTIKGLRVKQNDMALNLKDLKLKGSARPLNGDMKATLLTHFNSSVANGKIDAKSSLNYKDINNTLAFDVKSTLSTHGKYLTRMLKDTNVTVIGKSKIALNAKGSMKKVEFRTHLSNVRVKQNKIKLNVNNLSITGDTKPIDGNIHVKLLTTFKSTIADGNINAKSSLNYKDVNNTLVFDIKSNLTTHEKYLTQMLKDTNVTVIGKSKLALSAKGSMKKVKFKTEVNNVRAKQNEIKVHVNNLLVKGEAEPIKGNINLNLITNLKSTVANGKITAKTKLNFHDVNNSLKFTTKLGLSIHDKYVNNLLKEANITLRGETPLNLMASGNINKIKVKLDVKSNIFAQNMLSKLTLNTHDIILNLKNHHVKGGLKLNSTAKNIAVKVDSVFNGDYTKPKKMISKSNVKISSFNAFGVNLNSLTPLNLNIKNAQSGAVVKLDSKKIQLNLKSSDFDHLTFNIKTEKIYPNKIVKVPEELNDKFIHLNLAGDATISKQYFNLHGFIASNQQFKAKVDAKNSINGLHVDVHTKHLKIKATGNIEKKNIKAKVKIDSITKVQEEFARLYPFTLTPIDGSVTLNAKLKGEEVFATLRSPKIKLDGFNVEGIDIDAHYASDVVTLNKLTLETTGFEDNKLNRKFYLNKKGKIHLGENRDVSLDIHPNILVNLKGTQENLKGFFSIDALPLGYPKYGDVILTTHINYEQNGKKKKITGNILLDKMKLFYESKFLDPAHDSDVVVITKKDKNNKKENDSFLEDTYIDLAIDAKNAQYKTKDIDLTFRIGIKAKKEFSKSLRMLGKVHEINGIVEQAPKIFTVVDSSIVFRGTKEINPLLDIKVQYELPDVLITIAVHGDANRPKLDFSSDPQMPKKDILSYLVLGVSTAALSEGNGNLGREAELFIMNQAARDLAYELELDRVLIKDDGTGEGYAVQVGKKIDKKTMFVIESSTEGNSFILEYDVNKNIKVELGQHQKTVPSQSIDVFFRKKFR